MDRIRWGIIGCGDVTEVKSGPAFQKAERSELKAVMRRNRKLAEDYAIRHHVPRWYSDADALIADEEIEAVYVATPPASHREYVLKCAEAGKPVYVEKPMSVDYAAAAEMVEACRRADVPLFVAFYRRGMDYFNKVKEITEDGTIGEIRTAAVAHYFQSRPEDSGEQQAWRVRPEISGGGRFLDLGSHTLDILDYILGPICDVSGMAGNLAKLYEPEDVVVAAFRFKSGVFGTGLWCFCAHRDEEQVVISGSAGQIRFSVTDPTRLCVRNKQGDEDLIFERPLHSQQQLIQQVTDELTGRGKCVSTGETALRTSYVMDKILGRL
jgi:1,5-anhydro-D-fructose reductase (1,5-anhydro-D-mannitol-forming)